MGMGDSLNAWRRGFNPDGRQKPSDGPELDAATFGRMLKGEITAAEASRVAKESAAGHAKLNAQFRQKARLGYTSDAEAVLATAEQDAARVAVRDADGRFVNPNDELRAHLSDGSLGAIVQTDDGVAVDANAQLRADYRRLKGETSSEDTRER